MALIPRFQDDRRTGNRLVVLIAQHGLQRNAAGEDDFERLDSGLDFEREQLRSIIRGRDEQFALARLQLDKRKAPLGDRNGAPIGLVAGFKDGFGDGNGAVGGIDNRSRNANAGLKDQDRGVRQ